MEYGALINDADCKRSNPDRKKGLKKMKSGFLGEFALTGGLAEELQI